jgi:DNA-binding transcriptional MerR regulator
MAYTVKKVARMSGVSVRTLHFYDEVGLLKPASRAANGYRFYDEEQIARSKQKVKDWTRADWEKSGRTFDQICTDLVSLMERKLSADSQEAQKVIRRHHDWISQFWKPTAESYAGHSQLICDSDLRKAYEAYHPHLPEFAAKAMKCYTENELA